MKCLCLGQFLSNYFSYSQWYLVHAYILAWPIECSHPYLTLTFISQSIRHATSYLLIQSFWILIRMFALISSRSGSQSAMMLRGALQGHHGPLVLENRLWNSMQRRQFEWNVEACFLGKIRKMFQNVCWKFYPACKVLKYVSGEKGSERI